MWMRHLPRDRRADAAHRARSSSAARRASRSTTRTTRSRVGEARHGAAQISTEAVGRRRPSSRRSPTRRTRSSRRASTRQLALRSVLAGGGAACIASSSRRCGSANAVDFDDLLVLPVQHARAESGRAASKYQRALPATSWSTSTRTRTARSTGSCRCSAAGTATSWSSATTTSRSTAGAAPTSGTSSTSSRLPGRARRAARGELPLHAADPRARERRRSRRTPSAWARRCAPRAPAASASPSCAALDERDEADFVVEEIVGARYAATGGRCATSRSSTAPTRRAARWRRRCAAAPSRTGSSAPCASTTAARSATSWRISSSSPIPADDEAFRRAVAVPRRGLGDTTHRSARRRSPRPRASRCSPRRDARRRCSAALRPAARDGARGVRRARAAVAREGRGRRPSTSCCASWSTAIGYERAPARRGPGGRASGSRTCAS